VLAGAPRGAVGGHPAATAEWRVARETNVLELLEAGVLPTRERLEGRYDDVVAKSGDLVLGRGDVFISVHGGGGGVGDPLWRPAADVCRDVRDGYLTAGHARAAYGVELDSALAVDEDATATTRAAVREARIGTRPSRAATAPADLVSLRFADGDWTCASCDETLSTNDANWRTGAVVREASAPEALARLGLRARARKAGPGVIVREHYCPACAAALGVDVSLDGSDAVPAPRPGVLERWDG
jgi:N-methylhydantoinase B